MIAALKGLLVSEPAEDGLPLFTNSAKLAEAVAAVSPDAYQNPKTTAALLNFVFRCERTCSDSLRDAILKAVRVRLAQQPRRVQDDWVQRISRAAESLSSEVAKALQARAESDEDQFDQLLQRAEGAEKHFIITPLTAEQEDGVKRAAELNRRLLKHLGISPKNMSDPITQYWFLLPDSTTGKKFWEFLEEKSLEAVGDASEKPWVNERLTFLDKNGFIQVYIVPSFVCGCPIVVYDPSKTRDSAAFSFSHHPANVIDTIRWDDEALRKWRANVFEPFEPLETKEEALEFMKQNPAKFSGYRCHFSTKSKSK